LLFEQSLVLVKKFISGDGLVKSQWFVYLCGVLISLIYGFSFMFSKNALNTLEPFHILAFRFSIASLFLFILKATGIIKISLKGKKISSLFLISFFVPGVYYIFEIFGLSFSSSSQVGLFIALIPVSVAVFSTIILKERLRVVQLIFILLSVFGVALIILNQIGMNFDGNAAGIILSVGAVVSASLYTIFSNKHSKNFSSVEITFFMMVFGMICFNTLSITQHIFNGNIQSYLSPLADQKVLVPMLYLGVLSSGAAFLLNNFMLSKITATQTAVFGNLTTVISVLAGVFILKEPFGISHIFGAAMILTGIWGTNFFAKKAVLNQV